MIERRFEASRRGLFEVAQDAVDPTDVGPRMRRRDLVRTPPSAFVLDEPLSLLCRQVFETVHCSEPSTRHSGGRDGLLAT
jgi:hypothetical protein